MLVIILSLFLFNTVYAQGSVNESLEFDDNQISLQSAGDNDFISIQSLIDNAVDGDAIDLKNITYFGNGNPINIDKNITVNGNDAILDAQNQSGIFKISKNANVVLLKLTLTNAKEKGFGAAIQNEGALTINECNINSNKADNGVIYNQNVIYIYNSTFSSNSASLGGAVYNKGFLSIDNSKFISNSASDAAAIYSLSDLKISNCEFQKNIISHSCGVIHVGYGNANVTDSIFKNNKGSDEGCCIFVSKPGNVCVKNSKFIQNIAYSYAGAIDNSGNMVIDNSSFEENSAWGAGAIDNGGTLTILNSNFTRNSVTKNGGAIDTKGKMQAINCIFQSNAAGNEGGAIIFRGDANVTNSSFMDNRAAVADAIYINDVTYSINDNWWNSDNPDFSKLVNVNLTDGFTWITHESKVDDVNTTIINNTDNKTEVPVDDGNQSDGSVNGSGNQTDYKNDVNDPISTKDMIKIPKIKHVKDKGSKKYSIGRQANNFIPHFENIHNLNVKTNFDDFSKSSSDIKLILKINGEKYIAIIYSSGVLSFNKDNSTFWNLKIHQNSLMDNLIKKFNPVSLEIILNF